MKITKSTRGFHCCVWVFHNYLGWSRWGRSYWLCLILKTVNQDLGLREILRTSVFQCGTNVGYVGLYMYTAVQSQKAVSAYFTSKQILPFGFAEQCSIESLGFSWYFYTWVKVFRESPAFISVFMGALEFLIKRQFPGQTSFILVQCITIIGD